MITILEEKALGQLNVKGQVKWTYIHLANKCYGEKNFCWYGQEKLAKELNISVRTLQRHLDILKKNNIMSVKRRGKKLTNVYTMVLKPIGISLNKLRKLMEKSDTTKKSAPYEAKQVSDDVIEDAVGKAIAKYGEELVTAAIKRICKYKGGLNFNGFLSYFNKTLESVRKAANYVKYVKPAYKKQQPHFNNFEQRNIDYDRLERGLLGWDKEVTYGDCWLR